MKKCGVIFLILSLVTMTVLPGCGKEEETKKTTAVVLPIDLTEEEYAFGVDKDQPELLKSLNELLKEMQTDGRFDEICDHYFAGGTPVGIKSAELNAEHDQLVVATEAGFEPFEYLDGELYYGIDMEIAALLADALNKELVIMNMDFDAVCLSVGQHKCDIGMAALTVREDRKEHVNFSDSYYVASQVVICPSDNTAFLDCKTVEDVESVLKGLPEGSKAGFQTGTTGQFYIEGDEDWGFDGFKNITGTGYASCALAVSDMLNGNLNCVILDKAPAGFISKAVNALR